MLRPYQQAALDAIKSNYDKGVQQQLVSAATGVGKSVILSHIPDVMNPVLAGQMLVVVHRDELIMQNIDKLRLYNPSLHVSKEKASEYADTESDIIVASVATLGRKGTKRADRFQWDKIAIVVTDECHHSSAQSYLNVYEMADVLRTDTHKLHVGFTATPNRSDGEGLSKIFRKIVFNYGMRQAIEEGYLVDVKGIRVNTQTSLDSVKTYKGDFDQSSLAETVNNPERNQRIVKAWIDNAEGRSTVVFAVDIAHSKALADMFSHYGVKSEAVWGDDPERADKLARHRAGDITVLTNCAVLTEGYDDPRLSCVVLARPTKSGVFFTQAVGRGTRLMEGKQDCLVIDVVDASARHSLVTLPTLMGMSASLDLKGQGIVYAVKKLEEEQNKYPHIDFTQLADISTLDAFIENVNLFEVKFPPEVEGNSELSWYSSPTGGYVLMLPSKERLSIDQNLLDKFEISGIIKGQHYKGERDTIEQAFLAADDLVNKVYSEALKVLRREEKWHKNPASGPQLKLLAKLYKGKAIPPDLSSGQASKLISARIAGKS